ncbi:hypothetical protein BDN70DRAFT_870712 [Pholiota conissans]|uniref:Uncharacterized protein n=1 Tax=Pholiota conissans TaxID=109636 RepID=A0A9P5ZH75_9AGAR|nr:hypothetical protein BDN70DRAFT_870712 [Pholiota conissans]
MQHLLPKLNLGNGTLINKPPPCSIEGATDNGIRDDISSSMVGTFTTTQKLQYTADDPHTCITVGKDHTTNPPSNFDDIEAFKTITMMLGMLPRSTPVDAHDNLKERKGSAIKDSYDRQELSTLGAFAQLAAGEHDTATLATNRISTDGMELRIMSCISDFPMEEDLTITTTSEYPKKVVHSLYRMFLKDSQQPKEILSSPNILRPLRPKVAEGMTSLQYMQKLNKRWMRPSLPQHLWILENVLISPSSQHDTKFQSVLLPHLSRYTAAISYRKMARWFGNECLSIPYIKALEKVLASDIPPILCPTMKAAYCSYTEENNDMHFLSEFVLPYADAFKPQNGQLLDLTTKFPNLIEMALVMNGTSSRQTCQIYTNATRAEFHCLLLELLQRFQAALAALTAVDEEVANSTDDGAEKFNENVREVDVIGYGLLRICTGCAFRMHLDNIERLLLPNDPRKYAGGASTEDAEGFSAHQAVFTPGFKFDAMEVPMLLSQSYVNWLQFMVGPFRAVEILFSHITSYHFPYKSISLSILAVPRTTDTFLSWSRLFSSHAFIPAPNNDTILEFLQEGSDADKQRQAAEKLVLQLRRAPTLENLKFLKGLTYMNIGTMAQTILAKIGNSSTISDNICAEMVSLYDLFVELPPKQQFFRNLNKMTTFRGTVHGEASLSTLLPAFTEHMTLEDRQYYKDVTILPDMKDFGHVIGASILSCPSCAIFLQKLASMSGSPSTFVIRGNHRTISGCSLPAWTPDRYVKAMNTSLGLLLRQDLIALMQEQGDKRKYQ